MRGQGGWTVRGFAAMGLVASSASLIREALRALLALLAPGVETNRGTGFPASSVDCPCPRLNLDRGWCRRGDWDRESGCPLNPQQDTAN